jgi:N-carbamoyl-L-amino-acid hydrolase
MPRLWEGALVNGSAALGGFDRMWDALAPVGRSDRTGGYDRLAWTAEDGVLREWFAGEAAGRGLDLVLDRFGNQWAWWGDPDQRAGVVIGSHLDSVRSGGAFDGPLGVVSAFAALDAVRETGAAPKRPVGIVSFCDEEGARFGVACMGSRVITGAYPTESALALRDPDGVSMAEAMRAAGQDPAAVGPDPQALARIGTFVELHIEQGRGLADLDRSVAVGSSIWPHGRWRLDLPGEANHAGTTRLADRRDPMLDLARTILAARASATRNGCVATVARTRIDPGSVNAIPSLVQAWLDARGPDEDAVRTVVADVELAAGQAATRESWTPRTAFDERLVPRVAALLGDAPLLATGAGHDAGILANAGVSTAMLFVRNPTGVSHSPAEWAEPADCHAGVEALAAVLADLVAAEGD